MAESIVEIDGKDYILKMNRAAVRHMEQRGLDVGKFESQPATQLTKVVMTALYGGGVRLPDAKLEALADRYLDTVGDFDAAMDELMEMYQDVFPTRSQTE